jgi:hypothetical protein
MQTRITVAPETLVKAHEQARKVMELTGGKTNATFTTRLGARIKPDALNEVLGALVETLADGSATSISICRTEVSPVEAAQMLGTDRPTIMALIRGGDLNAVSSGKYYSIKVTDLEKVAGKVESMRQQKSSPVVIKVEEPQAANESIQKIKNAVSVIRTSETFEKVQRATLKHFFYV